MDWDVQEGLVRDEPQAHIQGGTGCLGSYAMLLYAAMAGLAIGSVIMVIVLFVPWVVPLAIVVYLALRSRAAVVSYSRRQGRR